MTTVPLASHVVERARERRWQQRRWARRLLEALALLAPFAISILVAWMLTETTPSPEGVVGAIARWMAIAAMSTAVLIGVERVTRRLLPVASLFDLTLVFPDRAPSRFKVALRTGTTRQLERRIEELKTETGTDPTIGPAQRLLELAAALNVHDRITRGHAERVRAYTQLIAAELDLSDDELDRIRWAGLLHDIGKLFVPGEILNKTGSLTDDEFAIIKQHPDWGRDIIEDLVPWLGEAARAVWEHHEKWDGSGYPRGLKGEEISLAGRIVAVADVYDVMTSARSYKDPISPKEARAELARCAGSHFDPAIVRAFLNVSLGKVHRAAGPLSWLTQLPLFPTAVLSSAKAAGGAALLTGAIGASSAGIGGDIVDFLDPRTPSPAYASGADGSPIDTPDGVSRDPISVVTSSTTSTVVIAPAPSTVAGSAPPSPPVTPVTPATTVEPEGISTTAPPTTDAPSTTSPATSVTTLPTSTTATTLPTSTTLPVSTTLPTSTTVPTTPPAPTLPPSLTTAPTLPPSLTTVPTLPPSLTTVPTLPPSLTTLPTVPLPVPLPSTLPTLPPLPTTLPPLPTTLPPLPQLPGLP